VSSGTSIEWTEATWNPTTGCDRISPGCDNCYAMALARRLKAMGQPKYQRDGDPRTSGPGFGLTTHRDAVLTPLTWRTPRRVFVNSMSDLFHPDVPEAFVVDVWRTMEMSVRHSYQILTKRPQRMRQLLPRVHERLAELGDGLAMPLTNVWLGTSIENDTYAWRAEHLRATDAVVRFLSLEPLLGPLPSLELDGISWVIVGGESAPRAVRTRHLRHGVFRRSTRRHSARLQGHGRRVHRDGIADNAPDPAVRRARPKRTYPCPRTLGASTATMCHLSPGSRHSPLRSSAWVGTPKVEALPELRAHGSRAA